MEGCRLKRALLKTLNLSDIPVRLCAELCGWLGWRHRGSGLGKVIQDVQ